MGVPNSRLKHEKTKHMLKHEGGGGAWKKDRKKIEETAKLYIKPFL
jgi:hypothetical protein